MEYNEGDVEAATKTVASVVTRNATYAAAWNGTFDTTWTAMSDTVSAAVADAVDETAIFDAVRDGVDGAIWGSTHHE